VFDAEAGAVFQRLVAEAKQVGGPQQAGGWCVLMLFMPALVEG
jgi:hypothetical protein